MNRSLEPRFPLAHTFSVVARDPDTGEMGVAVESHWFSVGMLVTWAEAGTGAVATQATVEVNYGPLGLELMRSGKSASEALRILLNSDSMEDMRQVAMVDMNGNVAVHTGSRCIAYASHETGDGFSVQANLMANDRVVPAMANAYRSAKGDLAERLMVTLEAGQAAGGDVRGQQSAALLVVSGRRSKYPWNETIIELRVEDHQKPIEKLHQLLHTQRAYSLMDLGDRQLAEGNVSTAMESYKVAASLKPDVPELPFWQAVALAKLGRVDEALPIFKDVFARDSALFELVKRLPASGHLPNDAHLLEQILAVMP